MPDRCGQACIPIANRCNGVSGQCGVGGDMWRGTSYFTASSDDESSCPSTSPTPACSNTVGTVATASSCTCNAGSCGSYSCSPGPGIGVTCLNGQYCTAAESACTGTASAGSTPTPPNTPTLMPSKAPTIYNAPACSDSDSCIAAQWDGYTCSSAASYCTSQNAAWNATVNGCCPVTCSSCPTQAPVQSWGATNSASSNAAVSAMTVMFALMARYFI